MRELLAILPRPGRYLGIEEGAVIKQDFAKLRLHVGLAFPDLYEVGMSYLGQKILYNILNDFEHFAAERVFAPCHETGQILKEHKVSLATLETDTDLNKLHALGFSITHELCYTNVLYMLDLANIPLRQADRSEDLFSYPIIMAGGGCTLAAEPLAPFVDLMMLGDGEEIIVEVCELLASSREQKISKQDFLEKATKIEGVYVPSLNNKTKRRVLSDLNKGAYPTKQVVPFGAVHNRLNLEIAKGCTRGCRFCQAGMITRPVRERKVDELTNLVQNCLADTGFDEISFLSLSTGDFSALSNLFVNTTDRCVKEQISVSLPSLRVGSVDSEIMKRMANIRRTGATLAPEAGSERLRQVINKGITEDQLLDHVEKLCAYGWQQVKLYFMIGLPTETDEDLDAIVDLCRKVRDIAITRGRGKQKLLVTASISPFVPKAHTPFQWDEQISLTEIKRKVGYLLDRIKPEKAINMRWHEPAVSFLEGVFSRGDRRLADLVELAYKKGCVFDSWMDFFRIDLWREAMEELNIDPLEYTGKRELDFVFPWAHLDSLLSKDFLLEEREKALNAKPSLDCRYNACNNCGVCDFKELKNNLNFKERDQVENEELPEITPTTKKANRPLGTSEELAHKAVRYRIWHNKLEGASFISQHELQAVLERSMRMANLPLAFSQGFHPLPLMSFGRALPVGLESVCEWFSIVLCKSMSADELFKALNPHMLKGMELNSIEQIVINSKTLGAKSEIFRMSSQDGDLFNEIAKSWKNFADSSSFEIERTTKKGLKKVEVRDLVSEINISENSIHFVTDWTRDYISPIVLAKGICPFVKMQDLKLLKLNQTL